MPFIDNIATEEDIKPLLWVYNPEQIYDLVYCPLPENVSYLFNLSGLESINIHRNLPFAFNFTNGTYYNNALFSGLLFQRYNLRGYKFANNYSTKLFNFLNKFRHWHYFYKDDYLKDFSTFDYFWNINNYGIRPSAALEIPSGVYTDLIFEELTITLPNNEKDLTLSYYLPEVYTDYFEDNQQMNDDWAGITFNYAIFGYREHNLYNFSKLNYTCIVAPKARHFKLHFEKHKCLGQIITINKDILLASLVLDFLNEELDWSLEDKNFILNQIPEYYLFEYLDIFFQHIIDKIEDFFGFTIDVLPRLPTAMTINRNFEIIVDDYKVSYLLNDGTGNAYYFYKNNIYFRENIVTDSRLMYEELYSYAIVYANNFEYGINNYNFQNLEDIKSNIYLGHNQYENYTYNFGKKDLDAVEFFIARNNSRKNNPVFDFIYDSGIPYNFGNYEGNIIFENNTLKKFSNITQSYYEDFHLQMRYAISSFSSIENQIVSYTFYQQHILGVISRVPNISTGDYYMTSRMQRIELDGNVNLDTQEVSINNVEILDFQENEYGATRNHFNGTASFYSLPHLRMRDLTLSENITLEYNATFIPLGRTETRQETIDLLIQKYGECGEMACCDELNEKLDLIIRTLNANKYGNNPDAPGYSRRISLGEHIELQSKLLGLNINHEGEQLPEYSLGEIEIESGIETELLNGYEKENRVGLLPDFSTGELNPVISYKNISQRFEENEFTEGLYNIKPGTYSLGRSLFDYLTFLKRDLDRALNLAESAATIIPNADGSGKFCYSEGMGTLLAEIAFMISKLSENINTIEISSLYTQAITKELLLASGLPMMIKTFNVGNSKIAFPGIAQDAPSNLTQTIWILESLMNISSSILNYTSEET